MNNWLTLKKATWTVVGLLSIVILNFSFAQPEKDSKFYDPVIRKVEGWTIKIDPKLLLEENKKVHDLAFKALANHLQRVEFIVPEKPLAKLKKLPIWIEYNNPVLSNMQYHPGKGWLVRNGHDPRLVKHVHLPRAKNLYDPKMWAKHPYVVLHELAHSYHDQYLDFNNKEIEKVFQKVKAAGIYDKVLAHSGRMVKHYALSNAKEYFAESTEAYFGVNDFYPFVRAELQRHDPDMYQLMRKFWGDIR